MANKSVLELAVETGKWDAGLKNAKKALDNFTEAGGGLHQVLEKNSEEMSEFVRMMGDMDSSAKTTRQQLREVTNVLTDFTSMYRKLSEEEKNSPVGKELAKSIQKLTEQAGQIRDTMADVQQAIQGTASDTRVFDQLSQGASVATASFQALTGAGKLLGVEMGNDVQVIAKLQSAMAITNGLTTIQTALQKESPLYQGLVALRTKLAAAAQKLYATATGDSTKAQAAFNAVAKANPYLILVGAITAVVSALGLMSSGSEEATSKINDTKKAIDDMTRSAEYYLEIAQKMGASNRTIQELRLNTAKAAMDMARMNETNIKSRLSGGGLSVTETTRLLGELQEASKLTAEATANYGKAFDDYRKQVSVELNLKQNWQNLNTEKEIGAAINMFQELKSTVRQGSSEWQNYSNIISQLQAKLGKGTTGGGGGGAGSSTGDNTVAGSVAALTNQMNELKKAQLQVTNNNDWEEYRRKIQEVAVQIAIIKGELKGPLGLPDTKGVGLGSDNDKTVTGWEKEMRKKLSGNIKVSTPKVQKEESVDSLQAIGQLVGSVNSIAGGLERLGLEIPKGFSDVLSGMQTVILILEAIKTIDTVGSILGIFHNGGVVHAANGFSGMVPGTKFSGDNIPALLDAGETVLNRSQTAAVASALESNNGGGFAAQPYVNGEQIWLGVKNYLERRGLGEIVTTKKG